MAEMIGTTEWVRMLRGAVEQIKANHAMLSELDSHGGDGDHGTTMVRAMGIVEKAIAPVEDGSSNPKPGALLHEVGWGIMGVDGGATGPLFGMFFSGVSEVAGDEDALDAAGLAGSFEQGLASVRKYTKAQVGDKTMIDALEPAVTAAKCAAEGGSDVGATLLLAAEAAAKGAESTKALRARFGRSKNVGEKSVGTQDPGATSVALVFKGFAEGVSHLA